MTREIARMISASPDPVATMLWESWETLPAIAPDVIPKPCTSPVATFPFSYRLHTTTFRISRSGSGIFVESTSRESLFVMICRGTRPMTRAGPRPSR